MRKEICSVDKQSEKKHVKPKGFEGFRLVEVNLPCQNWYRFYDIEHEIIWVNTAAAEECGIAKMEPKKW